MKNKNWRNRCWLIGLVGTWIFFASLAAAGSPPQLIYSKQTNIIAVTEGFDSGKAAVGDDGNVYCMAKFAQAPYAQTGLMAINPLDATLLYGPVLNPIGPHNGASISSGGTILTVGDWNSCGDGVVTAHRASDGAMQWYLKSLSTGIYSPHPRQLPAIDELMDSVYWGSSGNYSQDMHTGAINWVQPGGEYIGGCGMGIDHDQYVYYATQNSYTASSIISRTKEGTFRYKISMSGNDWFYLCAINQDDDIITHYRGTAIVYGQNGAERFRVADFFPSVLDSNGTIYGSGKFLTNAIVAVDAQGKTLYRKTLDIPPGFLSVVFCDSKGNLYARAGKTVFCIGKETGEVRWKFDCAADILIAPLLTSSGDLFFSDSTGTFYLLDTNTDYDASPWSSQRGNRRNTQNVNDILSLPDTDYDGDGVIDHLDNCVYNPNSDQLDADSDGVGNACDDDNDKDGVLDISDNCPFISNADQADNDGDGIGDVCDPDDDNDGIADVLDNCLLTANTDQQDTDGDGNGDLCDDDLDGDGVENGADNCPTISNPLQEDLDGDNMGDACDIDDDNDGVPDDSDNCPLLDNADQADLDADNIGDACDADIDGDGIDNGSDNCPMTQNLSQDDTDEDGLGDACDADDDNDGVADTVDNCQFMANADQTDSDQDGLGNVCDDDLDGDAIDNGVDNCPTIPNSNQADWDHDGQGDACDDDVDGDGVANFTDTCQFTTVGDTVDPTTGCSIDQLCPCNGPRGTTTQWKNHGQFVSCTAKSAENFVMQGLMTGSQKDTVVSQAATSSCGSKK